MCVFILYKNEKPFLIYVRSHICETKLGGTIPTSVIIEEWADLVQRLGPDSVLTCDSYYLDHLGNK